MGRDLRNRAYGMAAETKALFRHEEVTDDVLSDRVRAKLGRYPMRMGDVEVRAHDGIVTLTGPIHADELPTVLRATKFVRGVKAVDNQLTAQTEGQTDSSLPAEPQLGAQAT
jgi:osmotically-inducible protein OsmY